MKMVVCETLGTTEFENINVYTTSFEVRAQIASAPLSVGQGLGGICHLQFAGLIDHKPREANAWLS